METKKEVNVGMAALMSIQYFKVEGKDKKEDMQKSGDRTHRAGNTDNQNRGQNRIKTKSQSTAKYGLV